MGKRGNRSQLLSTLTKKQKKHLRDFGEEHPFYDRCGELGALLAPSRRRPSKGLQLGLDAGVSKVSFDHRFPPQVASGFCVLK